MSIEIHNVQRLRVYEEPNNAYGVAFGTEGSYVDVPFNEGTIQATLTREMLAVSLGQQYLDGHAKDITGRKRCSLTFTCNLASHGVIADVATASPGIATVGLLRILKAMMGGIVSGNMGSAAAAGGTTTLVNVTAGHGARFTPGGAIAVWNTTLSIWEVREIYSIATDALTLKTALRNAPTLTTSKVLNASTVYLTEDPDTSLQFILEGRESDDVWQLCGMQGSFSIDASPGAIPTITFTLEGTLWTNIPSGTITFGAGTYTTYTPSAEVDSELGVSLSGSAQARNAIIASAHTIAPAIAYIDVPTPGGVENVHRKRRNRVDPVASWSFTTPYQDTSWFTARDNRSDYNYALQLGNATGLSGGGGTMVLITCGTSQITNVQRADAGGIAAQMVEGKARLDTSTDQSTENRRSAMRLHFV